MPAHHPKTTTQQAIVTGFGFALASAALFALRPVIVKLVYAEGVDSLTLMTVRMAFSAPVYAALLIWFLRSAEQRSVLRANLIAKASLVGVIGYFGASYLDLLGLQYVTAQLGRMILYVYPTFVVLFGAVIFKAHIGGRTVLALLISYAGVALIFGHDLNAFGNDVLTGAGFILGSALCFAIYLLFSKPLIDELGSRLFTCFALLAASAGILVYFALNGSAELAPLTALKSVTLQAYGLIFLIAIFCTVIPSFFTAAAVSRLGSDRVAITAMIGPAVTSGFAVMVLGEAYTWYHFFGMLLTLGGIALLDRR